MTNNGENAIRFLNTKFGIVWEIGATDIDVNNLIEKDFEVFDDYAIAYDWYGTKHYFNENGEVKNRTLFGILL